MNNRIAIIALLTTAMASASEWYVGSEGKSENAGSKDAPWDIASALAGEKKSVQPGDTIFLLPGTYKRRPKELFEVKLVGAAEKPVRVRPAPGARATIDGGLTVPKPSEHLWIEGLEILVSEPRPAQAVPKGQDPGRPHGGMHMHGGRNCKYINLVIHDTNQAISCWVGELDAEIYGCVIYENGWLGTDRGHGHCVYTQNKDGVKTISNCIFTCKYPGTYTMHAYGSARADCDNFLITDNVAYGLGTFLIGSGKPSHNIRAFRNCLHDVKMQIGYDAPHNEDCEIRDNTILNGGLSINKYKKAVNEGNLVLKKEDKRPEGVKVVWLPNKFDEKRAHLVIYNWQQAKEVTIPAAPFLKSGDAFRLMDPKDLFGKPVFEGKCSAETVAVPVSGEFAVFVVLK